MFSHADVQFALLWLSSHVICTSSFACFCASAQKQTRNSLQSPIPKWFCSRGVTYVMGNWHADGACNDVIGSRHWKWPTSVAMLKRIGCATDTICHWGHESMVFLSQKSNKMWIIVVWDYWLFHVILFHHEKIRMKLNRDIFDIGFELHQRHCVGSNGC